MSASRNQRSAPFPHGVADAEGRIAYMANASGAIDALSLRDGAVLWTAATGLRPLLALDEGVAVLTTVRGKPNEFRIAILEAASGRVRLTSDSIVLPEWASVKDPEAFDLIARRQGNTLLLKWEAHARYRGGANPSAQIESAAIHDAEDAVSVDLSTGCVAPSSVASIAPESAPPASLEAADTSAHGVSVIGSRAYDVVEDAAGVRLRARDVASGDIAWERTLLSRPSPPPPLRP